MQVMKNLLVAAFLSASMLFSSAAQAMEIQKFDNMVDADQKEYVIQLVEGAIKVLRDDGRADLAEKVAKFFTTNDPGGEISRGMKEFEMNLAMARVVDAENAVNDPSKLRLEVEHAMIRTLNQNGITLPKNFMTVMKDFKPKYPPKEKK